MKAIVSTFFLLIIFILSLCYSCKKKNDNPCDGKIKPSGQFVIKEMIGDTAFASDTIFHDNYVQFQALDNYESVAWNLGSDPRVWIDPEFSLSFITALGTIPINFRGNSTPNTLCFPGDNGIYTSSKNLTLAEQLEKPNITLSPLIGKYKGYFTASPLDTFTVRLEYFDSLKYDGSITGSKNFYWFSNMPKGFESTTDAAYIYPELKHGFSIEMGYKCFVYKYDSYHQGKAWLSHDTLYINTGDDLVGRKKFIGKKL